MIWVPQPLEILHVPHPILRSVCQPVTAFDDELFLLAKQMWELLGNHAGLAASQVGVPVRLAVVQWKDNSQTIINPKILKKKGGTDHFDEMCLSIPGTKVRVERPRQIVVKYQDLNGKERQDTWKGLFARAALHEIDHMDAKLITDYGPPIESTGRP